MALNNSKLRFQINATADAIRKRTQLQPEIGIILGTGLSGLAKEIQVETIIDYGEIPNFVVSTVEYHQGKLIFGELSGKKVVAMQGRFHFYEGYSMSQIAFPVRVMKFLGARYLFISNACGSMNPLFRKGGLMLIDDHINLLGSNPLIGENDEEIGDRFPDMSEPYSKKLIAAAERIALENKIPIHRGVYVAMQGPCLETRAEYRFLRAIGADVVGMSTVPEAIAALHARMEVIGISVITDECYPECLKPVKISEIFEAAEKAEPSLTLIFKQLAAKL